MCFSTNVLFVFCRIRLQVTLVPAIVMMKVSNIILNERNYQQFTLWFILLCLFYYNIVSVHPCLTLGKPVIANLKTILKTQKASNKEKDSELEELRDHLRKEESASDHLRDKVSELTQSVEASKAQMDDLCNKLDDLEVKLHNSNKERDIEKEDNHQLRRDIGDLKREEQTLIRRVADVLKEAPLKTVIVRENIISNHY